MKDRGGEGATGRVGDKAGAEASVTPSPPHPIAPSSFSPCCQTSAKRYIKKHRDVATCDTCGMLLLGYGNERDYEETRKALAEQGTTCATMTQGALKVIAKPRFAKPKKRT